MIEAEKYLSRSIEEKGYKLLSDQNWRHMKKKARRPGRFLSAGKRNQSPRSKRGSSRSCTFAKIEPFPASRKEERIYEYSDEQELLIGQLRADGNLGVIHTAGNDLGDGFYSV